MTALLCAALEVSGGVGMICSLGFARLAALPLVALVLGFSGVSVHLQAFSLLPKEISKKRYLAMKICEGGIAMLLMLIFCLVADL